MPGRATTVTRVLSPGCPCGVAGRRSPGDLSVYPWRSSRPSFDPALPRDTSIAVFGHPRNLIAVGGASTTVIPILSDRAHESDRPTPYRPRRTAPSGLPRSSSSRRTSPRCVGKRRDGPARTSSHRASPAALDQPPILLRPVRNRRVVPRRKPLDHSRRGGCKTARAYAQSWLAIRLANRAPLASTCR